MRAAAKTRTAGTSVAILTLALCAAATSVSAPARAQQATAPDGTPLPGVEIHQVQLGDVFAGQTITVVGAEQAVAQATAAGNFVSTSSPAPGVNYVGVQDMVHSNVSADTLTRAGKPGVGLLESEASAVGNTSTVSVCCGTAQGESTQRIDAQSSVSSESEVRTRGPAEQVSADSSAIGNTQGYLSDGAQQLFATTQTASGVIDAQTHAAVQAVEGFSGYSATSVANDVEAQSNSGLVSLITRQNTDETAPSSATLTLRQAAGDQIQAQSTASGNNVNATSAGYTVAVDAQQTNLGDVTAADTAAIGGFNSASIGSYGVGNSVNAESGGGGQTLLTVAQDNQGSVTATATLNGGAGGESYVNATAVGNALQGYSCGDCSGGVSAVANQTNSGRVTAVGRVTGGGGSVVGASSAIGNTATFTVKSGG